MQGSCRSSGPLCIEFGWIPHVVLQVRSWLDDWETEATQAREAMAAAAADDYRFAENNPFLNVISLSPVPKHCCQDTTCKRSRGTAVEATQASRPALMHD